MLRSWTGHIHRFSQGGWLQTRRCLAQNNSESSASIELPKDLPESYPDFDATPSSSKEPVYDEQGRINLKQIQSIASRFDESDKFRRDIYDDFDYVERNTRELEESRVLRAQTSEDYMDDGDEELEDREVNRDISKLKPHHRNTFHGKPPNMELYAAQWNRQNLKERFAKFGIRSGVNPGVLWMTRQELEEQRAWDATQEIHFEQSQRIAKELATEEEEAKEARIREVEENLEKYQGIIAEYNAKIEEKRLEELEIDQAREEKIIEIQEYFGYAVDPSDPRFQKMMEQKEEEEKKAARLEKKREKEAKMIAQIRAVSEELS